MARGWRRVERRLGAQTQERGAAAVEFALIAMLLLTLVFGIAEFGRMWLLQSSLSAAARDGARTMAITNNTNEATAAAEAVFTVGDPVVAFPEDCDSGPRAVVTVAFDADFMTGFFTPIFGQSLALSGEGVMRCGG